MCAWKKVPLPGCAQLCQPKTFLFLVLKQTRWHSPRTSFATQRDTREAQRGSEDKLEKPLSRAAKPIPALMSRTAFFSGFRNRYWKQYTGIVSYSLQTRSLRCTALLTYYLFSVPHTRPSPTHLTSSGSVPVRSILSCTAWCIRHLCESRDDALHKLVLVPFHLSITCRNRTSCYNSILLLLNAFSNEVFGCVVYILLTVLRRLSSS